MDKCATNEIVNPTSKRCIKINGPTFKKIDITKLSLEDQVKIQNFTKPTKPRLCDVPNKMCQRNTMQCLCRSSKSKRIVLLFTRLCDENKIARIVYLVHEL